jgi:predicted small lipoprotein YifL
MKITSIGLIILFLLAPLSGCGNTGDLYLPEDSTMTYISVLDSIEE